MPLSFRKRCSCLKTKRSIVLATNEMLDIGRKLDSILTSAPRFFSTGVTMACFIDCGTIAVESDALIMRVMAGHRALMFCLRSDFGSGSSSHDLVADAKLCSSRLQVKQLQDTVNLQPHPSLHLQLTIESYCGATHRSSP